MGMTPESATAVAHPNFALSKYWGKRPGPGNFPAVPSLSVTVAGMSTRTMVRFSDELGADELVLNGVPTHGEPLRRVGLLLDRVRSLGAEKRRACVVTSNDFPTASGLASSASGFAALALGATQAARLELTLSQVSDLARRSSASAARSLFGGFVELPAGPEIPDADAELSARPLAPATHLDLRILVCVTSEEEKGTGSTLGMRTTAERSPYYGAWLDAAPRLHGALREALLARDFQRIGELAEASAMAMHASALAAGIVYFRGATLDVLAEVRALRRRGVPAYATVDAGPHVKVLVPTPDVDAARRALGAISGVLRLIEARVGEGASVVAREGACAS